MPTSITQSLAIFALCPYLITNVFPTFTDAIPLVSVMSLSVIPSTVAAILTAKLPRKRKKQTNLHRRRNLPRFPPDLLIHTGLNRRHLRISLRRNHRKNHTSHVHAHTKRQTQKNQPKTHATRKRKLHGRQPCRPVGTAIRDIMASRPARHKRPC
jgi:hypothetical protein